MDSTFITMLNNVDTTTAVMFFYLLYRLEGLNREIKDIKEKFGIKGKEKDRVGRFWQLLQQKWNGTQ